MQIILYHGVPEIVTVKTGRDRKPSLPYPGYIVILTVFSAYCSAVRRRLQHSSALVSSAGSRFPEWNTITV